MILGAILSVTAYADDPIILDIWPGKAPGETKTLPAESDQTKDTDPLIAGRRIIKLGNVSTPQIAVYRPRPEIANGAAVVICPGGGHYILAYDLEGTEVAQWFNSIGVTAIVLKYRVPFRDPDRRWLAAVQDAQRAISIVRSKADDWQLDPKRIGILGFSAGGETAALATVFAGDRKYGTVDAIDEVSSRPDFSMLIYPGNLVPKGGTQLHDYIQVTDDFPPFFFVHAFDDPVTALGSLALASALKQAGVSTEMHLYATGGHGYGLRHTDDPVTHWPEPAEAWLRAMKFLDSQPPSNQ